MGLLVVLALLMLVFTPGAAGSDLVQSSGNPPVDASPRPAPPSG
jgi:ethanolamine permease